MSSQNSESYHFNYQPLDQFLTSDYDPKEVGNQLDEIMTDLVYVGSKEEDFGRTLREHHYLLRELRNIFWNLKKS